ncbi:MAG: DUF2961 domain-containing protein [Minicystis sp.]
MRRLAFLIALSCWSSSCSAPATDRSSVQQTPNPGRTGLDWITRPLGYTAARASSYDRSGGNGDNRRVAPGETLTLMDEAGPGVISHVWMTIASADPDHLKNLILRMYWDGETVPSVESPVGAFFGLGLGEYVTYQSIPLAVAPNKALNAFFPMPFRERARITIENQGPSRVDALYFNIDYRAERAGLPPETLYFHAQYRAGTPRAEERGGRNETGEHNYVLLEATGRGHLVGVTMSLVQSTDGWWGEGDEMFFVDGERRPSIHGTGSEDYFLGAWDFGGTSFHYGSFGAPVVGRELAGEKWSLYRFHLDAPITFDRSIRATIEHGHANDRADPYASVAYWYQTEPHLPFPALPPPEERLPRRR